MARKIDNINKLINILKQQTDFISASQLARLLGLNNRTIRNYLSELKRTTHLRLYPAVPGIN